MKIAELVSGLFVTYEDFSAFMNKHKDDFCYWIGDKYLNQKHMKNTSKSSEFLSAMFIEQIANHVEWIEQNDETEDICFELLPIGIA